MTHFYATLEHGLIRDMLIIKDSKKPWVKDHMRNTVKIINEEVNTLFESIVKNLENNNDEVQI